MHITRVASGPSDLEVLIVQLRHTAAELGQAAVTVEQIVGSVPATERPRRNAGGCWPEARASFSSSADGSDQWARVLFGHVGDLRKVSSL